MRRSGPRTIDEEREYLESLLNTRFNFFLVFASFILVAAFSDELTAEYRTLLLATGLVVSALMTLAVGRTRSLLQVLLGELRKTPGHPYARAFARCEKSLFRTNANTLLLIAAGFITLAFAALSALSAAPVPIPAMNGPLFEVHATADAARSFWARPQWTREETSNA